MNKISWRIAVLIGLLTLCTTFFLGCATGNSAIKDNNTVSQIKEGISTKSDVLRLLGKPTNEVTYNEGTEEWGYGYVKSTPHPLSFIPCIGIGFSGRGKLERASLGIHFTKEGIVDKVTRGSSYTRNKF